MIVRQKMPVMLTARMSPDGMMSGRNAITATTTTDPLSSTRRGSLGGA